MSGYHWNWGVFLQTVPSGEATFLGWLLTGMRWTLEVGLISWVIALGVGAVFGVLRTLPNRACAAIAALYVECFRNTPLLVQLFLWYFVFPEVLPKEWGLAIKQIHPETSQLVFGCLGLGLFTSARICEQVRAGIESLPRGQLAAARALGLRLGQAYRFVLLPQAFRLLLPALTSEFLNIFKNSAVVSLIGLLELSAQARQLVEYTGQAYESFAAATLGYLLINGAVMLFMRGVEAKFAIPGLTRRASS